MAVRMAMVVLHSTLPCFWIAEKRKWLPSGAAQGCTPAAAASHCPAHQRCASLTYSVHAKAACLLLHGRYSHHAGIG